MNTDMRTQQTAQPTICNNTDRSIAQIEALEHVGIHVNNWQQRTVRLFADPSSDAHVYAIGRFHDGSAVVLSREALAECMNFRIAIDYWKHGQKTYTRD